MAAKKYRKKAVHGPTTTIFFNNIPLRIKDNFSAECRRRGTNMTAEFIEYMKAYIKHGKNAGAERIKTSMVETK